MEPMRAMAPVTTAIAVGERQAGGGKRQADAFRQALQQDGRSGEPAAQPGKPVAQRPLRPALQQKPVDDRKEPQARHVDVIA